jgi:2-polyprenyl-3-methyl-5-hydroxy-6-metoxy-1,4-benzoquinol methylase
VTPCVLCGHDRAARLFMKTGYPYLECRRCGLVTRGGSREAETYHDYLPTLTQDLPELTRRRYVDILDRLAAYRATGRFLDVGCGGGFLVEVAAALGWQAEGLEVSQAAAEFGRSRGTVIHAGTLEEADLPESVFDLITMMEVVEHVADPVDLLMRAGRLLRPGGALYLTTPNWGSLSRRFLGKRWFPVSREHVVYFAPGTIRTALGKAGLRRVRTETANIQPHEILARFRPAAPGGSAPNCMARTMSARESIEASPALRTAKDLVNRVLGATGTGDTLRALAERPS